MQRRDTQKGMTFWSLLFVLGVLAFFLFIGFKLFPPYLDDFKLKSALDSLVKQPDVGSLSKAALADSLRKRIDIDNIGYVDPGKDLSLENRGRVRVIRVRYQPVIPLMFNVSALLEFDHTREVRALNRAHADDSRDGGGRATPGAVAELGRRLRYAFSDPGLLERALTHRSKSQNNYERLEFLGDSILNFVVSAELFERYPALTEGELTRLRAALVRQQTLAELAPRARARRLPRAWRRRAQKRRLRSRLDSRRHPRSRLRRGLPRWRPGGGAPRDPRALRQRAGRARPALHSQRPEDTTAGAPAEAFAAAAEL